MKKLLFLSAVAALAVTTAFAQADKTKRPSPPAKVTETTSKGVTITIDYSQPSLKGRSIGKEVAPYGEVWRAGANEPTTIEVSKDVKVEGQALPAGKYSLWAVPGEKEWAIVLNKEVPRWGTMYPEGKDAFRVNVKPGKAPKTTELMTYEIAKSGKVTLLWGDTKVDFNVQ
jgi:hypothetical protein